MSKALTLRMVAGALVAMLALATPATADPMEGLLDTPGAVTSTVEDQSDGFMAGARNGGSSDATEDAAPDCLMGHAAVAITLVRPTLPGTAYDLTASASGACTEPTLAGYRMAVTLEIQVRSGGKWVTVDSHSCPALPVGGRYPHAEECNFVFHQVIRDRDLQHTRLHAFVSGNGQPMDHRYMLVLLAGAEVCGLNCGAPR